MPNESNTYNEFQVGDLITAYHSGFHVLERIERRFYTQKLIDNFSCYKNKKVGEEYSPLFHYRQVVTSNYRLVTKKTTKCCDASLCRKIDSSWIQEQMDQHLAKIEIVRSAIHELELSRQRKGRP